MKLEVRVWGMDSTGKPFSQVARTVEISGNGARLEGVTCLQQAGEVIGVQHGNQKARFRILWIGENGTAEQGQIGIGCLESGKCIWWQALQDAGDDVGQGPEILSPDAASTIGPPPAATGGAPQAERRRYPRYQCSGKVLLTKEGTEISTSAKLTDIGLGGCYAETFTPLALHTPVDFVIQADELEIRGRGMVRTAHPSVGNGIGFTQMTAEYWQRLNQLIARVTSPIAREVPVQAVHTAQADIPLTLEALLRLLEKKEVLTRDEFLTELMSIQTEMGR